MHRSTRSARGLVFPTVLSLLVAALLAVTSVAGLLFGARGLYDPNPATLPAFVGQDALSLTVGLPLLLGSVWLTRRGSLRGLLVWLGALFYVAYSYAYYLLHPEFNVLYLAYVTIVAASGYALLYLLLGTDAEAVRSRFSERTPVRPIGGFMAVMALVLTLKWVGMIVVALDAGVMPPHKELVVWPMDLAIALPALFWGGVWLWRRQALGYLVGGLLLVKATFLGLTLVVNSWLVTFWGEALDPMVPAYALIGLGSGYFTFLYLHGVRTPPRATRHTRRDAMGTRVLVGYATRAGSTAEVANEIAATLRESGAAVDAFPLAEVGDPGGYDALVLGSAVRAGKVLPELLGFVERHRTALAGRPVAYFVVCATLREDTEENRRIVRAYLDPLVAIRQPVDVGLFAGVLEGRRVNPAIRLLLKLMRAPQGDWRDWPTVRAWSAALALKLRGATQYQGFSLIRGSDGGSNVPSAR
jgi:menaquinone-dependent protoporphyrinogen oxidase